MRKFTELFDKTYLQKWLVSVLSGLLALGLMVYIAYHIYDIFSPELELVDAVPKTITETITSDAYIMRKETPLYSGVSSGSVAPALKVQVRWVCPCEYGWYRAFRRPVTFVMERLFLFSEVILLAVYCRRLRE